MVDGKDINQNVLSIKKSIMSLKNIFSKIMYSNKDFKMSNYIDRSIANALSQSTHY